MLRLPGPPLRLCNGLTRRDLLRAGALGGVGLTLSQLLRLQHVQAAERRPAADACILVFLWGAPSQFETFDPKPDAPDGIRGEFGVRHTRLPGVLFGEHIPMLAEQDASASFAPALNRVRTINRPHTKRSRGTRPAAMRWPSPPRRAIIPISVRSCRGSHRANRR